MTLECPGEWLVVMVRDYAKQASRGLEARAEWRRPKRAADFSPRGASTTESSQVCAQSFREYSSC